MSCAAAGDNGAISKAAANAQVRGTFGCKNRGCSRGIESDGPADRRRGLVPTEPGTDHHNEIAALDLAEPDGVVQCHRNTGGAGVAPFVHDGVAFLERHAAPLGGNRDRAPADLGEDQLVHLFRLETAFGRKALEQAWPIILVDRSWIVAAL